MQAMLVEAQKTLQAGVWTGSHVHPYSTGYANCVVKPDISGRRLE